MKVPRTRPSLSGRLTMLSGIRWPVLISILRTAESPWLEIVMTGLVRFGLPCAWILLVPSIGSRPTHFDIVLGSVVMGMNSVAWEVRPRFDLTAFA